MNTNGELIHNYLKQKSDLPDGIHSFEFLLENE